MGSSGHQRTTTLHWLSDKKLSVAISKVLYEAQHADKQYLFVSGISGRTLAEAWRAMNKTDKQYYVRRIAGICKELSNWKSDSIAGVDGAQVAD